MLKIEVVIGLIASALAIIGLACAYATLSAQNLQFEAFQISKENPPQVIFVPAGHQTRGMSPELADG